MRTTHPTQTFATNNATSETIETMTRETMPASLRIPDAQNIPNIAGVRVVGSPGDAPLNIERAFAAARPRLLRIARGRGIEPESADDIVQETLLVAWGQMERLRDARRFDAWLDGICRNLCLHHLRGNSVAARRWQALVAAESDALERVDETSADPADLLERRDLETLLDRALGHLPEHTRSLVEICYLEEVPQREAALQLGLTISALEAQLHRARKQLRKLLEGELRGDAESFGLAIKLEGDAISSGWHETRCWCHNCARRRLRGKFEPQPDGTTKLRLRCPLCSPALDLDVMRCILPLANPHSFLPAIKLMDRLSQPYWEEAVAQKQQICPQCGHHADVRIMPPFAEPELERIWWHVIALQCPWCQHLTTFAAIDMVAYLTSVEVQQFIRAHPRWIDGPQDTMEYEGLQAIRCHLSDLHSADRLAVLVHPETLHVLKTYLE